MRKTHTQPEPDTVRFIVDCRDGSLDQMVPRAKAKELFEAGKIAKDVTNGAYCSLQTGDLSEFSRLFGQPLKRQY